MVVISTREFREKQKKYFDLARDERVVVKSGKNYYTILATNDPDSKIVDAEWLTAFFAIPEEYRCNPFEMSPSGDTFYADKRNVEKVLKAIEEGRQQSQEGKITSCRTLEENMEFFENL